MKDRVFTRRLLLGMIPVTLTALDHSIRAAKGETAGEEAHKPKPIILEAGAASLKLSLGADLTTAAWGYNLSVPGPLLRLRQGEELSVRLENKLSEPSTLHWHGVRVTNAMDGVAGLTQDPVLPGASFDYLFTPPDSGLYWYHPHVLGLNNEQIGRGLYGVLIVDEAEPPYADRDMLIVIGDWKLLPSGEIDPDFGNDTEAAGRGRIGDTVTLNSQALPRLDEMAPGSRIRFRILSAVNARIMFITFKNLLPMILAVDGQPCDDAFVPVQQTIPIGPGARFDIMGDLPPDEGAIVQLILHCEGETDRELLNISTKGAAIEAKGEIPSLPKNPLLPGEIKLQDSLKIDLIIESVKSKPEPVKLKLASEDHKGARALWTINSVESQSFAQRPLFSVKRGTPVTLGFINRTDFVQQMHVHGHHMRLLHDLDDGWEPYWRDAVLIPERKSKHAAFVADNPGKWVIESLILDRNSTGLATWFEVK